MISTNTQRPGTMKPPPSFRPEPPPPPPLPPPFGLVQFPLDSAQWAFVIHSPDRDKRRSSRVCLCSHGDKRFMEWILPTVTGCQSRGQLWWCLPSDYWFPPCQPSLSSAVSERCISLCPTPLCWSSLRALLQHVWLVLHRTWDKLVWLGDGTKKIKHFLLECPFKLLSFQTRI